MAIHASRVRFAGRYALRHLAISGAIALVAAIAVFGLLYPAPYRALQGVGSLFMVVLAVDVVCGPLLTLVVASPRKSTRERWLDFGLIGLIQAAALAYGLHSMWAGRPVALVFEIDRLVAVTANEIETAEMSKAPEGMHSLPMLGVMRAGIRKPIDSDEMFDALSKDMGGVSPAMRPGWWIPWEQALPDVNARAKPLSELLARRSEQAPMLRNAAQKAGAEISELRYLPLTSSKTKDWTALLDSQGNMVGYAAVDAF